MNNIITINFKQYSLLHIGFKMKRKINIYYLSTLCSPNVIDFIFKTSREKPGLAVQKFHRLLVEGLASIDEIKIETLSTLPVVFKSHKKLFWNIDSQTVGNVKYHYIPIVNFPYIKNTIVFLYTFFKLLFAGLLKNNKQKVVICDILNLSVSSSALLACKITNTKIVTIVTDLPGLMLSNSKKEKSVYTMLASKIITGFDGYILLTQQMNEVVNPKNKPYIIMEGLVDVKMGKTQNQITLKDNNRIIIYAGGLYEKYGIKTLIEAFMKLKESDLRLYLFGSGDMETQIDTYSNIDNRIVFFGVVPNQEVVDMQLKATLLVNPRPTTEEFTKFSFPSKNMEYMVSGTPLVTTNLPGMPDEYRKYVFLFNDECTEGMYHSLKTILSKSKEELHEFGLKAKEFVLKEKSNYRQSQRIANYINENFNKKNHK